jgi:signal transduction histidine kinase
LRALAAKTIAGDIKLSGLSSGVLDGRNNSHVLAFTRLEVPSLYFVVVTSRAPIEARAAWAALAIVGAGLFALLGTGLMIFLYARRLIVRPLERLARHSLRLRAAPGPLDAAALGEVSDLEARQDEIGDLAHCLAQERARADEVLQSLEERVAQRTGELDRANRAKSSFLANMSHELRTPLNGVVALSDLLAKRQSCDEDRKMAELVVSSAKLLEQVLTDILDVSKIEAGQMALTAEPFDLESLVGRIAQLHSAAAQRKGVALVWTVSPAAAGRYMGDEVRITQVLSNLLSNAVKFTAEGQVSLTADAGPEGLTLTVQDTGIGFDPQLTERLFKRFEQADASVTRQFGGTGLGLAICASLCALMGGRIDAHSAAGRGARFTVTLPLPRAGEAAHSQAQTAPSQALLDGVRVLLAEDHPTNQKVVCLILEPLGCTSPWWRTGPMRWSGSRPSRSTWC